MHYVYFNIHLRTILLLLLCVTILLSCLLFLPERRHYFALNAKLRAPSLKKWSCRARKEYKTSNVSLSKNVDIFYQNIQNNLPPTLLVGNPWHSSLCDPPSSLTNEWSYCLPISGRIDVPYCRRPNRNDLLQKHSPETLCLGSVLHMIMVDVYNTLEELGHHPALIYGSLLGAVRNESIIPYTEDVDIGYQVKGSKGEFNSTNLISILNHHGYHVFFYMGLWRVCVAPTHPLASNIYDSKATFYSSHLGVRYGDLYTITEYSNNCWVVQGRPCTGKQDIMPYVKVKVNDMEMNTLAKAILFLEQTYGRDFMKENRRNHGIGR